MRSARAAVLLDPSAGALVHALKYRGWREVADLMARRMVRELPKEGMGAVLVPVPTTPWRRRVRGYNQAGLLAEAVARLCEIPVAEALWRREGRTQVHLGPQARHRNVRDAFCLAQTTRSLIRGRDVILIDDVLTTGATAIAASLALASGGAREVRLLTFARSLPFAEKRLAG